VKRDFTWGVSTSAYQIEGAADEDGRTPSVWDTFCRRPGAVADGSNGNVACDHYHRCDDDLALMSELGVDAYRFSVSWSRVQPDASGPPNPKGLDFYARIVDGLRERGITPVVNLFHWDLPQWAQDAGGWQQRDISARFAEYAALMAERLDGVGIWSTTNEPFEHFVLGHVTGTHAPGLQLPLEDAFSVAHHLLLGHGQALQALRAASNAPVIAINSYAPARPATDSDADRAMADLYDLLQNRLFTEPPLLGRYPEELEPLVEPYVRDGDLDVIAGPLDAWGVNYYSINAVRAVDGPVPLEVVPPEGYPRTAFDWAVSPEGLSETLLRMHNTYGERLPPLIVTENGCAYDDVLDADGRCHDPDRIAYLDAHLQAVQTALDAGVDVRGYYVWSLLDNFEWAEGYTKRFGLVHVDYPTQTRTPKSSFGWYRGVIQR
jgi:beta-glucosidase